MRNGGHRAFACVRIDEALRVSAWVMLSPKEVRIELDLKEERAVCILCGSLPCNCSAQQDRPSRRRMNRKTLGAREIGTKFITPTLAKAGWTCRCKAAPSARTSSTPPSTTTSRPEHEYRRTLPD
jgi:hypothetical protein